MSFIQRTTLLLSVLSSLAPHVAYVSAAPTPQNLALAQQYAPQFRFHKDEIYFASTIEFFLQGPVSLYDANGPLTGVPSPLTDSNLATAAANQGNGTYLTTNINANLNGFLRGQDPRISLSQSTTYTFIAPKANGVIDLYYWIFCPYNLGKKIPLLGYVGDHVGDWERMSVRTVNGVPQSVDYPAHSDTGSGTIPWAQAPKFSPSSPNAPPSVNISDPNARPVSYVAQGSHGMWSSAGTFTYVNAVVFKLQDVTSDGGAYWDTVNSLTELEYPDSYTGDQSWLNYLGDWGNKGINDCWWFAIHDECELVDGPPGPARTEMSNLKRRKRRDVSSVSNTLLENLRMDDDLPSHALATAVSNGGSSSYTIYIDVTSAQFVVVEQVCASVNGTSIIDSTRPTYSYTSSYTTTTTSSQSGGTTRYTIAVPPCAGSSFVSSYSVGLCNDTSMTQCSYGNRRAIRAYSTDPAVLGPQEAAAAIVHDLDNWVF